MAARIFHLLRLPIDADALAAMKPGVVLVNAGRGRAQREPALIGALKEGRLSAAGLDVYEEEVDEVLRGPAGSQRAPR